MRQSQPLTLLQLAEQEARFASCLDGHGRRFDFAGENGERFLDAIAHAACMPYPAYTVNRDVQPSGLRLLRRSSRAFEERFGCRASCTEACAAAAPASPFHIAMMRNPP
jgi:hypothetical protein